MSETNQEREDEVLRRMLKTPPKPHKEKGGEPKPAPPPRSEVERWLIGVAPALASLHFRNAPLIPAKVCRDIVLEFTSSEARLYEAESFRGVRCP